VVITKTYGVSGNWAAGADIAGSAYNANAATLSALEAMSQEAGELVGVDPEVVIAPEGATA